MSRPTSRIHQGLTRQRELVGAPYMADPALRAEYEAEMAPRTHAAMERVLSKSGLADLPLRRALDLGAGTGAAGQVLCARFPGLELVSVDRAPGPGVIVADLRHEVRPRGVDGTFDLVVAAHLLNELGKTMSLTERAALVFAWARELLADGGHLVLIEPALRETSRDLLAVRDRLISAGYRVVAPCLWQKDCPALVRERDWCHDAAPWSAEEAAARAGRSRVDFSYVVLTRAARLGGEADDRPDRRLFRIVSDPIPEKGRLKLWGCGPSGRHALVRLDREKSEENAGFDEGERGDVLIATRTEAAGDGLRITAASRVERRS